MLPPEDELPDDPADPYKALGTILSRAELATLPKVSPLISGVMSSPATVVLVGGYGVGKTFLALSIAAAIGTGTKWLGRYTEQRRVLYVIGEGAYGMDDRMTAWEQAWGYQVGDSVTFVVQPRTLKDDHTWDVLGEFARAGRYGVVIIDTFSSTAPDADETKDAAFIMRQMGNLATRIQGTTMLVHHPGWSDASRVRGGYQFEANADEVLVATEVAKGSELFTLLRKKVKDGPDGKVLYLRRKESHGSCIIEETGVGEAGAPMRDRILMVLTNYGAIGGTGPQILDELEVAASGRSTFYKALGKLLDEDDIHSDGKGKAARYYIGSAS